MKQGESKDATLAKAPGSLTVTMPSPSVLEWISLWPWAEMAMLFFGFTWGAMLGSFINVVVHRVPLGASIVTTPSRCPTCGTSIRPYDNVPVLGWLWLGGRCRSCREPIAATYPLVEAGCGAIVMVLAASELVAGGRWLPAYAGEYPIGIDRLFRGDWWLLATCCLHASVALTIVTWSLLDGEGYRVPSSRLLVAIALALAAVSAIPAARLPAVWPGVTLPAMVPSLVGLAVGSLFAAVGRGQAVRWGLPLLGSVLGWQGVIGVAIVTASVGQMFRSRRPSARSLGLLLAVAGTLAMAFGGVVRQLAWW